MILIIGAGIGGLTLALKLYSLGLPCRIYEAVSEIKPLGVGINVLPHAMRELCLLGLEKEIALKGVETKDIRFYNKFGQHIFSEKRGRFAGYEWPQYSIHRGDLQSILLKTVLTRLGPEALITNHRLIDADQTGSMVQAHFTIDKKNSQTTTVQGKALIGCDGIHSAVRKKLHPKSDKLIYSGITMWRGVTRWPGFLTCASMVYVGWLKTGKVIAYPISSVSSGEQEINWLCEFYCPPRKTTGNWSKKGELVDFFWACKNMKFDWLNIPKMVQAADFVYEYPMVDKDPLGWWTSGCISLLGDAAHPMYPRGSNGAGQAILDAVSLAVSLASTSDYSSALQTYEATRRIATTRVVNANREMPPDAILKEVFDRTGDQPFKQISEVISQEELVKISNKYKTVAGFDIASLTKVDSIN